VHGWLTFRRVAELLAVALALWLFLLALPNIVFALKQYPPDGYTDWISARSLKQEMNPYSPEGLRANGDPSAGHPPTTGIWFLPLLRFPIGESALPLGIFILLLLSLHTQILAQELRFPSPLVTGALAFSLMTTTVCMKSHIHAGQLSELIAFLYVLGWYFLRRQRDVAAGATLGLACTIKLFPGLMVCFLVARRRWRAAIAAGAVWLVVAVAVTTRFGVACWGQFFALQEPIAKTWVGMIQNASLHGIVVRFFGPACGDAVAPPTGVTTAIILVTGGALLAAAWRLTRRIPSIDVPFALFSVLSIFLNPWIWEHYNVFYLLPVAVILAELRKVQAPRWQIATVGGAAVAAAALIALDTSIAMMHGLQASHRSAPTAATHLRLHLYEIGNWLPAVVFAAVLAWIARRRGSAPRTLPRSTGPMPHLVIGPAVLRSISPRPTPPPAPGPGASSRSCARG
jgi:hypothetical protein